MSKLQFLGAWREGVSNFFASRSAQGVLSANFAMAASGACGASCGAGDEGAKKEEVESPACGSSCGASDDAPKEEPKSSACGAGDGK